MRPQPARCRMRRYSSEPGKERRMKEDREERIGIGYTTHDKHIHPHYCNNPPATHQCSFARPPIYVSHHRFTFSLYTQTHTHTRTLLAIHFKQMYQCSEILNSSFINRPSSAIRADKLSNLRTAEQNHFSMQYCQPGEVPHQYFCQIMSECFLWLLHCKLILLFPWSMRKAEGSTGRISALAMGLKALKHTHKRIFLLIHHPRLPTHTNL